MGQLTITGSPTFNGNSCNIDSAGSDEILAPASVLTEVQGWIAVRLAPTWASTALPNAAPLVFEWRSSDLVNQLAVFRVDTTNWSFDAKRNSTTTSRVFADTHAANDHLT